METILERLPEVTISMLLELFLGAACSFLTWQLKRMMADSRELRKEFELHKRDTATIVAELRVEAVKQLHELHTKYTSELMELERRIQDTLNRKHT